MEIWVIFNKLFILLFVSTLYAVEAQGDIKYTLLILFLYLCVNISIYMVKPALERKVLILLSAFISYVGYLFFGDFFLMLIIPNIYEFILAYSESWIISAAFCLIPAFIIQGRTRLEYILLAFLSLIIFFLRLKSEKKLNLLSEELDRLKERNYSLNMDIRREEEHKQQIKYVAQLEERNKLSQEIHDEVGHTLSASLMQLEAVKLIMDDNPEKANQLLQNIIFVLRQGMNNIRLTLRNIKPTSEQMGINRLKLLAEEFQAANHITVMVAYSGGLEYINYEQWKVIYDNSVEVMTNTLKYAHASAIKINIQVLNKLIKHEIEDNGVGCFKISKGLGLKGIEERCVNTGGKVIIDGSRGFSVIALLPMTK
jgi:signal transduction histidine kinase